LHILHAFDKRSEGLLVQDPFLCTPFQDTVYPQRNSPE